ncbi:MAG: PQQ-binding-like beta-propeller repeat protein [Verrucomicrobiales bacterium]|nr:PQQ-binding-like beta-propeller repeat protein [Verrucomicrobiales bacterium]
MKTLPFAFFLFCVASFSQAEDWQNWLGPQHNGRSSELLPQGDSQKIKPIVLWEAEVGIGFSSISVAKNRVYTMGNSQGQEMLWCFSAQDGKLIWSDHYPAELMPRMHEGGPGSTPSVHQNRVYTISKDGQLHSYSADQGKLLWHKNLMKISDLKKVPEWGFAASPVIYKNLLLVEAGATFAFDKISGALIWKSDSFKPAYGSGQVFSVAGKDYLATLKTDGLVILSLTDGKTLAYARWRTSFQTNATTPLSLGDGKLFISTGYDRGCALFSFDGKDLQQDYENKNMCNHMGNSVLIDGYLYGFDGTAHRGRPVEFTCIEAATGKKQWQRQDLKYGSLIAVGKDLLILTETGKVLYGTASPKSFTPRSQFDALPGRCWTPPAYANGKLYVRNAAGKLRAFSFGGE